MIVRGRAHPKTSIFFSYYKKSQTRENRSTRSGGSFMQLFRDNKKKNLYKAVCVVARSRRLMLCSGAVQPQRPGRPIGADPEP